MEAQNNIKFSKSPLLTRLLDIASNPYKIAFCEKVVAITADHLIHTIHRIKENLANYKSVTIYDFISSNDLSVLIGDGHFDAECNTKYLQDTLTKTIQSLLQQELEIAHIKVRVDFSIGKVIINRI